MFFARLVSSRSGLFAGNAMRKLCAQIPNVCVITLALSAGMSVFTPMAQAQAVVVNVGVGSSPSAPAANSVANYGSGTVSVITENNPSSFTPVAGSASADPLDYSVSPVLPAGLSMYPATGIISGTPTAALATFTVTPSAN
jgi:hypothetical protein